MPAIERISLDNNYIMADISIGPQVDSTSEFLFRSSGERYHCAAKYANGGRGRQAQERLSFCDFACSNSALLEAENLDPRMLKFHLLIAVWGDPYIETMVRVTIPMLLYDGNVPAMAARHKCKVRFFVRADEEQKIRAALSVIRLASLVPIEFIHFDPDSAPNVYLAMSDAHHLGGQTAKEEGARVIVVAPDALFADGTLASVARYSEQGKVAVVCPGPRLVQETALPALMRRIDSQPLRPIGPREVVALTLEHLHPESARHLINSPNFSTFPTFCMWSLGAKGVLIRSFHLHPVMIDFSRIESLDALKEQSIDGALLGRSLADWKDVYIETDSDNLLIVTLAPAVVSHTESRFETFDIDILRATAHTKIINALHRFFFTKALKLHTEDLDGEWEEIEAATMWIADAVQSPPPEPPAKVDEAAVTVSAPVGRRRPVARWLEAIHRAGSRVGLALRPVGRRKGSET